MRHLLKDTDLTPDELLDMVLVARLIKRRPATVRGRLAGCSVGLLFEKPSLRTRVSTETACALLGAHPVSLRGDELHLHRGETAADCARVLSGYLDLLMARVISHQLLVDLASVSELPVVNGLCDCFHPLQALADLLTIIDGFNGRLRGVRVTYLGDGNNVATSLMLAGVMVGVSVTLSCPEGYQVPPALLIEAERIARVSGGAVALEPDPTRAVAKAQVLYTDVWTSMGDEGEEEMRRQALQPYQINRELVAAAPSDAIVLHCLPAHFDEEITREVFDSPQSRVVSQAHNRLPTAAAVFLFLLNRELFYQVRKQYGDVALG
jgi:ornithine carbamoyltransferase